MADSTSEPAPHGLVGRLRDERGIALPVVMGMLVLMLIFLATASTRATIGLDVSRRDVADKRALQTAKAGLRVAVYRTNAVGLDLNQLLNPSQQCLVNLSSVLGIQVLPAGSNWCTAVTEDLGTESGFSYRISSVVTTPPLGGLIQLGTTNYLLERKVVSTGTVDGVSRRVYAELTADGTRTATSLLFVNLLSSGTLQIYRIKPGSLRECTATPPNPGNPASGC